MAQDYQKNLRVNFTRGLITEQTPFELVPNATVDELNCDIDRDGIRSKRKGIQFERYSSESNDAISATEGDLIHTIVWDNVGGTTGLDYLIVQKNSTLYFYKISDKIDDKKFSGTVDLTTYQSGSVDPGTHRISGANVNGFFVIVSPSINPFVLWVDEGTFDVFNEEELVIRERDFKYFGTTEDYESVGPDISGVLTEDEVKRVYDTYNCGWTKAPLDLYLTGSSNLAPPLISRWYSAKNSSGDFTYAGFNKLYGGSSLVGNGRFIIDIFTRDREVAYDRTDGDLLSTVNFTNYLSETETSRFKTVCSHAGRVFYAGLTSPQGQSKLYFSKTVEQRKDLNVCYQVNDPTSEDFSDLIDSDGGLISISECANITGLMVFGPDLLVFASNGVWAVRGIDGQFSPSSYYVEKVTTKGLTNTFNLIDADDLPIYLTSSGVHIINRSTNNIIQEESLSDSTVQSFVNSITPQQVQNMFGVYEPERGRAYWIYPNEDETVTSKKNKILIFDFTYQAFIPWEVADDIVTSRNGNYIASGFCYSSLTYTESVDTILLNNGDTVVDSGTDTLTVVTESFGKPLDSQLKLVCYCDGHNFKNSNTHTPSIRFATFNSPSFTDWYTVDGDASYDSYLESAYDFMGDLSNTKTVNQIAVYMKVKDIGYKRIYGDAGSVFNTSGLTVSTRWDFSTINGSTEQQCFNLKVEPTYSPDAPVDGDSSEVPNWQYPITYTQSNVKVTGRGKVVTMRFEGEAGKSFYLLGFEADGSRNREFDNRSRE